MTLLSRKNKNKSILYGLVGVICFILQLKFYYGLICFAVAGIYFWLAKKAEKKEVGLEEEVLKVENLLNETEDNYTEKDKKQMEKIISSFGKKSSNANNQTSENKELDEINEYISKLDDELAEMEGVEDYEE